MKCKSHTRGSATCSSLSNDVLYDQKISHLCIVDRNVNDVHLTDPPLNIRRCQGLHITDKDMWLLGPYLLCQCVRRGASEGHKSQPKLGQASLTSHFTLSLLTFISGFHCRSRLPPKIDFHAIWRCRGSPQKSVHRAGSSLTTSSRKAD